MSCGEVACGVREDARVGRVWTRAGDTDGVSVACSGVDVKVLSVS